MAETYAWWRRPDEIWGWPLPEIESADVPAHPFAASCALRVNIDAVSFETVALEHAAYIATARKKFPYETFFVVVDAFAIAMYSIGSRSRRLTNIVAPVV